MDYTSLFSAVAALGGIGLLVGIGLAIASKVFYVYVDPMVMAVDDVLPGANCGGCGLPGCSANAEAIVAGTASPSSCVAGGEDLAEQIANILGVTVAAVEPDFAQPGCYYGTKDAATLYTYDGISQCQAVAMLHGGMKECTVGCLGLGSCVQACLFGALSMGEDGLPVVDKEKCTGCGACERVCPKTIINLSSVSRRIVAEYTNEECTTPCQRECPAGIDIRSYIHQITLGDFNGAVRVIKERNPFPAVCGRICPHPCEFACRRNLVDESVAINYLKRFAADYEMQSGERVLPYKAPETGRKAAVVGGGIQGLTAAFFLARLGHGATVLEATGSMGGLLKSAIGEERLSQKALDWEIQGILDMGVDARLNTVLGKDATVSGLLAEGFEAVFVAGGGWDARLGRLHDAPAEPAEPGVHLLIDLVKKNVSVSGKKAVFAGGGKAAVQAALASEAASAAVVLRTPREDAQNWGDVLDQAKQKGINILFHTAVSRMLGTDENLEQVEVMDLASGEKSMLDAQALLVATGRLPEMTYIRLRPEGETENGEEQAPAAGPVQWEALPPYKKPAGGGGKGLLAPADDLTDFSAAVEAIGAGRRAAASVHALLNSEEAALPESVITPSVYVQDVAQLKDISVTPRQVMPLAEVGKKYPEPELELGYTREMAQVEAARCLQCGLICYRQAGPAALPMAPAAEQTA